MQSALSVYWLTPQWGYSGSQPPRRACVVARHAGAMSHKPRSATALCAHTRQIRQIRHPFAIGPPVSGAGFRRFRRFRHGAGSEAARTGTVRRLRLGFYGPVRA
jgi:hypothetical protein